MKNTNKHMIADMARALLAYLHDVNSGLGEVDRLMRREQ